MENNKTSLGMNENIEALLCYILGWISGLVFLLIEKENKFVRFHAMQSIVIFLALFLISLVSGIIPILGAIISPLLFPVSLVLEVFLMYKAFKGEKYKFPFAGNFAEKQI
ncbi:MAG: DUF4870 domain-containing protein [Clostridiales bacterium]|nr:DUF4870 domain-containing protein [Clostridiales bacterium]MCF8023179.1 DUF4870 domain-containing protein [Clostridiales bacterium]